MDASYMQTKDSTFMSRKSWMEKIVEDFWPKTLSGDDELRNNSHHKNDLTKALQGIRLP